MPNLWTLVKKQGQSLPILTRDQNLLTENDPARGFGSLVNPTKIYKAESGNVTDYINVVQDFPWTINPKESRTDVPYILLTEKRLLMNSNVANLANSIFTTFDAADNALSVSDKVKSILDWAKKSDIGFVKATGEALQQQIDSAQQIYNDSAFKSSFTLGNDVLSPYDYLYSTEYTGFNYKLPYMSDAYTDNNLSFGGESNNLLSDLTSLAGKFAEGTQQLVGTLKPGTYIERAQQYSMGESGRNLSFTFPLLNTKKVDDILRNWQLIFGLIYQNRPGRFTRAIIDMPVIYTVQIPGIAFMPYAYISSLSVEFVGSRRMVELTIPVINDSGGPVTCTTIVPDAYKVSMTISGLNEESRNFLYASLQSAPVRVNPNVTKVQTVVSPGQIPQPPQLDRLPSKIKFIR